MLNINRRALILFSFSILATIAFGLVSSPVKAAGGITVSPAFLDITFEPEQTSQDVAVSVRNDFDAPIQVHAGLAGLEQRGLNLVPSDQADSDLLSATRIFPSEFVLQPKQSINVQLHIENTQNLDPGGHYASLLIRQIGENNRRIGLQPAISIAMFVVKNGGEVREVQLTNLTMKHSLFSLPFVIDTDFKNTGNVHLVPRGVVSITRGDRIYAKGVINENSIPLFPEKTITVRSGLNPIERAWLPGKYNLSIQYRYDGQAQAQVGDITFWFVPARSFFVLMGLAGALHIIYLYGWLKTPVKSLRRLFKAISPKKRAKSVIAKVKNRPKKAKPIPEPPRKKVTVVRLSETDDRKHK